jgi:general secretion pathway protein E
MLTLRQDGAQKVLKGITTIEEVLRVTQEDVVSQ